MTFIDSHASDLQIKSYLLVSLGFATPLYWTDCDIAVHTTGGQCGVHRWEPRSFTVQGITTRQADVAGASIEVANGDLALSAIIFAGSVQGSIVNIYEAWWDWATNKSQVPDDTRQLFKGRLDSPHIDRSDVTSKVSLLLGPLYELSTKMLPRRKITDILRA